MIIQITCHSKEEAKAVAYELSRHKDIIGFSPEYLKRLGLTYTIYENKQEFKNVVGNRISANWVILEASKMLDKTMTLVEFLGANKKLRTVDDVAMYFNRSFIDKAIKAGAINVQKGRIIV